MAEFPEPGTVNPDSDLSNGRAEKPEIDTSAPFESVREAATRFGGFGFWRPSLNKLPDASQVSFPFSISLTCSLFFKFSLKNMI